MTAALRFGAREIAPQEFEAAARRAASVLEQHGICTGDVVCMMLHNRPGFLEAMFAARLLGAYYCPVNWHYKSEEAGWILRDSGAKALVTDPELRSQVRAGLPSGLAIIDDWQRWHAGFAEWSGEERSPGSLMPYTSGTTGR